MFDEQVKVEAKTAETKKEPKAKREPKPKAEPKPMRFGHGWDAEKWAKHLAQVSEASVPEGWLGMADVCRKAEEAGIKVSRVVTASGGDRAGDEIWDPIFKVVYVGGRKFMAPEVLVKGFELLLNPNYHTAKRGRVAKPKEVDTDGKPVAKVAKVKIKPAPAGEPQPWIAK